MTEELHLKYRPVEFEDFIGQDNVVKSIEDGIVSNRAHSFLFSGPSGNGKTSLARAIANYVGAEDQNIIEVDASHNGSVDNLRELFRQTQYKGFGKNKTRVIIIDEVHSISNTAWQSVLKPLEEPPENTYYILCTTELQKVPKTVKTRCIHYDLKEVSQSNLFELLSAVSEVEEFNLDEAIIDLCVEEAFGSPRQALVNLSVVSNTDTRKEAASLLDSVVGSDDSVITLCRLLVSRDQNWEKYLDVLKNLEGMDAEGVRITILSYVSKVLSNTKDKNKAGHLIELLDIFSEPYRKQEKFAPLYVNIGQVALI